MYMYRAMQWRYKFLCALYGRHTFVCHKDGVYDLDMIYKLEI